MGSGDPGPATGEDPSILAVDLGTGGPKVGLVSAGGRIAGHEFEPVDLILPPDGGAEQDPEDWWRAIVTATRRLLARHPAPTEGIAAVSITAHWFGTVPVGPDGESLGNALIWLDDRGAPYSRRATRSPIRVAGYGAGKLWKWLRLTGGVPSRTGKDPVGHILYLEAERPDVYERTAVFLEPMDFLNLRLTGRAAASHDTIIGHWVTDNRNAARVAYRDDLIRLAGLDREKLPELVPAGSVLGTVTERAAAELGVPVTARVVTGSPDIISAGIGAGAVGDREPHLYVGTSSWLSCHVPSKRTDVIRNIASLPSSLPGRYWVAAEQEAAGSCLAALRDWLYPEGEPPPFDDLTRLAEGVEAGSERVLFLPWLKGERTPVEDPKLRGGFLNLSLRTTRAHLVRAVLEGVAYNTRWMHRAVERFVKRRLDRIPFVGGGATSPLWAQIHADVLDRTIHRMAEPALANLRGAAFLAANALGLLRAEEIPGGAQVAEVHEPNPANRRTYDDLAREFLRVHRRTKDVFARLNQEARP